MTRDEGVRLACRAIGLVQWITAIEEITYLPERALSLYHYTRGARLAGMGPTFLESLYGVEVSALLLRIAGFVLLGSLFWKCSPGIARLLLSPEDRRSGGGNALEQGEGI